MENCHGNHVEMQAMSEMFNRPIEVYQYSIGITLKLLDMILERENIISRF